MLLVKTQQHRGEDEAPQEQEPQGCDAAVTDGTEGQSKTMTRGWDFQKHFSPGSQKERINVPILYVPN